MPRIPADDKSRRKERIRLMLERQQQGMTEQEIANAMQFERRTINNYLNEMERQGEIYKEGTHWFFLSRQQLQLRKLDLSPEEAMALYLATRLFVKQTDRRNESAESVLLKIAQMLSTDAGLDDDVARAAEELAYRPMDTDYQDTLHLVMRAYLYRQQVEITYQPYNGRPFKTRFSPYLLEPSTIGFATYAIGWSDAANALRTYKVGRIQSCRLTRQPYTIPEDFDGLALLRSAWSIYYGEDVIDVTLRFAPEVAMRIQETNWHPSQKLTEDGNHLCMRLQVADVTDLKPWIRGWGAACEVLEPADLRAEMTGEARRLAALYGWMPSPDDENPHSRFNDIFGS